MQQDSSAPGVKLGFLSYVQGKDNGSGRGALLVTDDATRPLEFRCTTPIKPNTLQRMLYGQTLRSYIAAELVGEPLLRAMQEKPLVLLVREPLFLKLRPKIDVNLVCIRRQGEQISDALSNGHSDPGEEPRILNCATGRFQPLTVTSADEHPAELDSALDVLRPIFSTSDLLEPFDRIEKVVAELDRQEDTTVEKPKSK